MEYQRGSKAMTIPAHNFPTCRDVLVKCIKFVLPEDLDISGGSTQVMCNPRSFKARFIAHNIDSDFRCCESVPVSYTHLDVYKRQLQALSVALQVEKDWDPVKYVRCHPGGKLGELRENEK